MGFPTEDYILILAFSIPRNYLCCTNMVSYFGIHRAIHTGSDFEINLYVQTRVPCIRRYQLEEIYRPRKFLMQDKLGGSRKNVCHHLKKPGSEGIVRPTKHQRNKQNGNQLDENDQFIY